MKIQEQVNIIRNPRKTMSAIDVLAIGSTVGLILAKLTGALNIGWMTAMAPLGSLIAFGVVVGSVIALRARKAGIK